MEEWKDIKGYEGLYQISNTGIYQSSISRCCNKEYGFKTAGGYHWEYVKKKNG